MERFQKLLAQTPSDSDRKLRIIGDVRYAVEVRHFTVEELAHEEGLRKADTAQLVKGGHTLWLLDQMDTPANVIGFPRNVQHSTKADASGAL